jgi:hypothetical protein
LSVRAGRSHGGPLAAFFAHLAITLPGGVQGRFWASHSLLMASGGGPVTMAAFRPPHCRFPVPTVRGKARTFPVCVQVAIVLAAI